jgi:tetratricopeptide (TPR) repeat protein
MSWISGFLLHQGLGKDQTARAWGDGGISTCAACGSSRTSTLPREIADAQAQLDEAMACAKNSECSYQQGNILRSMGMLQVKRGRVDLAIDNFQEALAFHRKAQGVSEQATDLKRLGELYTMAGRIEDAAAAFEKAAYLMESVREARKLML